MSFVPSSQRTRVLIAVAIGLVLLVGAVLILRWRATKGLEPEEQEVTPIARTNPTEVTSTPGSSPEDDAQFAADPALNDRDGDGLTDLQEQQIGTDLLLRDTDGDGRSDEEEVQVGSDPLAFPSATPDAGQEATIPSLATSSAPASTPVPPPASLDQDADGILDANEAGYGTDPLKSDTDGDGFGDAKEIQNGYNPLGPGLCSRPDCLL